MIAKSSLQRSAVSATGALLLSGASILAAVSPAQAEANAPLTIADWQQTVEARIDDTLRIPVQAVLKPASAATVRVHFDGNGAFAGARISRSTGNAVLDREALRTAGKIRYPTLPEGLRGRPQIVDMKLFFGNSASDVMAARGLARGEAQAAAARARQKDEIAARPSS